MRSLTNLIFSMPPTITKRCTKRWDHMPVYTAVLLSDKAVLLLVTSELFTKGAETINASMLDVWNGLVRPGVSKFILWVIPFLSNRITHVRTAHDWQSCCEKQRNVHYKIKLYPCRVHQCPRSFGNLWNLRKHEKSVHGIEEDRTSTTSSMNYGMSRMCF